MRNLIGAAVATIVLTGLTGWYFSGQVFPVKADTPIGGLPTVEKPKRTLKAFGSIDEIESLLARSAEKRKDLSFGSGDGAMANSVTADQAASAPSAKAAVAESITNNQQAGVDEGGIVKSHGDHLVILRRGRLFTVKVGGNSLEAVSSVNAYPPGINPNSDWYDEMLVSENTVVVIGYSYSRGGTEINLFDINRDGGLKYRSTYHLRSNDYYSSRNYASRLIGDKLVFYTPQYISGGDPIRQFPALRRWHKGAADDEFAPVVSATSVYRSAAVDETSDLSALHTVTVCDLSSRDMACKGTAILGAPGRVFYVSGTSVYVWTTDWNRNGRASKSNSVLYKMPLSGGAPSGLQVSGAPIDQFSFLETETEGLNVLVRSDSRGEQMWGSERSKGDVALFRTTGDRFSDGSEEASYDSYLSLAGESGYSFQNRFVGDYMLYGTGNGWGSQNGRSSVDLHAVNWKTGAKSDLSLQHNVDRIEPLGNAAVVVGTNGTDLYFSPIRLDDGPVVMPSYVRNNASQGELRSHGFFYKPDSEDIGLLGLPIAREGRAGYKHLTEGSAAILFLRNDRLSFGKVGELETQDTSINDGCRASCVDWYGNARPIFIRGRIFALLGYEIVEGRLRGEKLSEIRRLNYSPNRYLREVTSE